MENSKERDEMNRITMTLQVDHLLLEALKEDISSEDVTTIAVMKEAGGSDRQAGGRDCGP